VGCSYEKSRTAWRQDAWNPYGSVMFIQCRPASTTPESVADLMERSTLLCTGTSASDAGKLYVCSSAEAERVLSATKCKDHDGPAPECDSASHAAHLPSCLRASGLGFLYDLSSVRRALEAYSYMWR
jgi:hypothetical protein